MRNQSVKFQFVFLKVRFLTTSLFVAEKMSKRVVTSKIIDENDVDKENEIVEGEVVVVTPTVRRFLFITQLHAKIASLIKTQ